MARDSGSDQSSDTSSLSQKKFRQQPEVEGFYRFIYENDLRQEAFQIMDTITKLRKEQRVAEKKTRKKG